VTRVVVEADGGARGNPGPAGYGAVVKDADTGEVLAERFGALGVTTNNVAEYRGLIAGLAAAAEVGAQEVDVRMDSKLVVEQMSGRWQIKHPGLRPLAAEVATLIRAFERVRFGWIPRERNRHADALANRAMDAAAAESAVKRPAHGDPAASGRSDAESAVKRPAYGDSAGSGGGGAQAEEPSPAGPAPRSWEPPVGAPTRLILVRHGETELTEQRRYSGRGDVPLAPRGQAQARAAAARVAGLGGPVAAVVSSPLLRCTETAATIAEALDLVPVRTDPDLVECDFGDWEGHTFGEVRERWPAELDRWLGSTAVAPPGGESMRAVASRAGRALARLRENYAGRWVVVVSHVSPVKVLLRDALTASDELLFRLYLDPGGLSIVDYWTDGGVSVRTVNDTAHLAALDAPAEFRARR
jgi:ribonuclease H / adenosylcobalamin/alpha-ribazole phosphatase